jgi:hypothetical protein
MNGMRQIPALGIAIPQLPNIRFVITITNAFLAFSPFISLTDCVHSRAFCTWMLSVTLMCVTCNCCSQKLLAGDPLKHLHLEQAGCQHQAPASVKLAHLLSLHLLLVYTHPFIFFFCYAGDCVLYDEGWAISRCLYEDIVNPHMRYFCQRNNSVISHSLGRKSHSLWLL